MATYDPILLKISEAATLTGLTEPTIRNYVQDGKLQSYEKSTGKNENVLHVEKVELLRTQSTIMVVFNQKGGVSKTTTAVLLGDYYEKQGRKVLLADFDQQGNLSQTYFESTDIKSGLTLFDFFAGHAPLKKIVRKASENIDVLPSNIKLASLEKMADMQMVTKFDKEFTKFCENYEVIIIDCPPALNAFSTFAVVIAHYIILPLNDDPYCYLGLADAVETINTHKRFNPNFKDFFAFSSKFFKNKSQLRSETIQQYSTDLGTHYLVGHTLPNYIGFAERPRHMRNILDVYPNEPAVKEMTELFDELDKRMYYNR
jgi:chromosome partitioning protein